MGWIATWSEPGPALVIGAIEEEPFDIWPVAQPLGCAHAEQEGDETLTPLLRRKTLIGSGSEECPTCAPNQRRSTQPPVTVTGRVTSEPGCSRETQLTRRTKESHADYNAGPLWSADSDRRGRADDHHPTRNPLHHAGRDRTLKAYVLTTTHAVNSVVSILAFALLVIALVALYDREARSAGAFGALAFGAAVIGTMFMTGDWWYEAFAVPRLAEVAPDVVDTFVGGRLIIGGLTSFALFGIGWIMYGAASTRARVIPRSISITIIVAGLMSGVPIGIVYLSGGVVHGLAFVWLGAWMLRAATVARVSEAAPGR